MENLLIAPLGGSLTSGLCHDEEQAALLERAQALPGLTLSASQAADLAMLASGALSPALHLGLPGDRLLDPSAPDGAAYRATHPSLALSQPQVAALDLAGGAPPSRLRLQSEHGHILGLLEAVTAQQQPDGPWLLGGLLSLLPPRASDEVRPTTEHAPPQPAGCRSALLALERAVVLAWDLSPSTVAVPSEVQRWLERHQATLLLQPARTPDDWHSPLRWHRRRKAASALAETSSPFPALAWPIGCGELAAGLEGVAQRLLLHRNHGASHVLLDPAVHGAARADIDICAWHFGVQVVWLDLAASQPGLPQIPPSPEGELEAASAAEPISAGVFPSPALAPLDPLAQRQTRGGCLWLTGLSGAGKSTITEALVEALHDRGHEVTVLDGDVVRVHLSQGLGFDREARDTNIRRIGFVAREIVRHGGWVICAAISPYRAVRDEVRARFAPGSFVEVFVDTPLEVCEARDVKGLYARARRGELKGFTGIDDPYEPPVSAEVRLDTVGSSPSACAAQVMRWLDERRWPSPG